MIDVSAIDLIEEHAAAVDRLRCVLTEPPAATIAGMVAQRDRLTAAIDDVETADDLDERGAWLALTTRPGDRRSRTNYDHGVRRRLRSGPEKFLSSPTRTTGPAVSNPSSPPGLLSAVYLLPAGREL